MDFLKKKAYNIGAYKLSFSFMANDDELEDLDVQDDSENKAKPEALEDIELNDDDDGMSGKF